MKNKNIKTNYYVNDEKEIFEFPPLKSHSNLIWKDKRSFLSTQYHPATLKEVHGNENLSWSNKIYLGDNGRVMSHLLKDYRGKVKLIYIDPPFNSNEDYHKKIKLKQNSQQQSIEDKQYTDTWVLDEYLQFMYERLILCRELLSNDGSIYLHCDFRSVHHLKILMDEIFGNENFVNEIIWKEPIILVLDPKVL